MRILLSAAALFCVSLLFADAAFAVEGRCVHGYDAQGNQVPCDYAPPPVVTVDPRQQEAYQLNEEGRRAMREKRYEDALKLFERASRTYPDPVYDSNRRNVQILILTRQGDALRQAKRHDEAIRYYELALTYGEDAYARRAIPETKFFRAFDRGRQAYAERRWDDAIAAYNEALTFKSDDAARNNIALASYVRAFDRGRALLDQKRWSEAADAFREALGHRPGSDAAQKNLDYANKILGREAHDAAVREAVPKVASGLNETLKRKITRPAVGTAWRQGLAAVLQGKKAAGGGYEEGASTEAKEPFDRETPLPQATGDDTGPASWQVSDETPPMKDARQTYERLDVEQTQVREKMKGATDLMQVAVLKQQISTLQAQKNMAIVTYNQYKLRKPAGQGKTGGQGGTP